MDERLVDWLLHEYRKRAEELGPQRDPVRRLAEGLAVVRGSVPVLARWCGVTPKRMRRWVKLGSIELRSDDIGAPGENVFAVVVTAMRELTRLRIAAQLLRELTPEGGDRLAHPDAAWRLFISPEELEVLRRRLSFAYERLTEGTFEENPRDLVVWSWCLRPPDIRVPGQVAWCLGV